MKIAIYGGGSNAIEETIKYKARKVGSELASRGHTIVTGGCHGIPQEAVLGAYEVGGECIAFSPAKDLNSHTEDFKFPTKGLTDFRFVPADYPYIENMMSCLQYRCFLSTSEIDGAIIIGGGYGTLLEFILAYTHGKKIGVLEETEGVTKRVIPNLLEDAYKNTGAEVIFESQPLQLVDKLLRLF